MYQLYSLPGTCAKATQVVLRELQQEFEVIPRDSVADFQAINPVGAVPALETPDSVLTEGAAILLHLLKRHPNHLMPAEDSPAFSRAVENMMFANATMHPAYGRLFFLNAQDLTPEIKQQLLESAAREISRLWHVVEQKLERQSGNAIFLGGERYSPADILLTVYSSWGAFFPVDIQIGPKAQRMIAAITELPTFFDQLETQE